MNDMSLHPWHISQVLGQMVKNWERVLPEGVIRMEQFSRENGNVLILHGEQKRKILDSIMLRTFVGKNSGQKLDLSLLVPRGTPQNGEASPQERGLSPKEAL